jgi:HSP20 family protein
MMLARFDPFHEMRSVEEEFNRLIGRTFGGPRRRADVWMPALDLFETDDRVVVTVELPGLDPDDVEVKVEDQVLTVSGKREFSNEVEEDHVRRIERSYGSFMRQITLPQSTDAEKIKATFDKGVLTIEVPKAPQSIPHTIEVRSK